MQAINGKAIAQKIIEKLKQWERPDKILAAVQVGEDGISASFLAQKEKVAKELGTDFRLYKFSEKLSQDDLRKEVGKIANLSRVGGIIVQLPLLEHIDAQYVLNAIPREKDIDVLGERALGAFYAGRNKILPPAAGVVEELLRPTTYDLRYMKVAIVGLGNLVGKPIAVWLMKKCKELYLLDKDSDLSIIKEADMIISGTGQAGIIKSDMLKEGASVIDFGYSAENGKLAGDFDVSSQMLIVNGQLSGFYTPTPGGTGPILVAKLMENFYILNK